VPKITYVSSLKIISIIAGRVVMNEFESIRSSLWVAPLNFDAAQGITELRGLDAYISELSEMEKDPYKVSRFYSGDPITVTLRGVMILEGEDPEFRREGRNLEVHLFGSRKSNDLLITSNYQFGTDPTVEKIHFMQKGAKLGYFDDFRNRRILAIRDFKDLNEGLMLNLKIYDIDKMDTEFLDVAKDLANSVVATIPVLYQYSIPLNMATGIIESGAKLFDNLDPHDRIIDERIDFEATEAGTGHPLLQQGYYVVLRNPAARDDVRYLKLVGDQLKVLKSDRSEFKDCSYAIIEVHKKFMLSPEEEIDEKAAKLASELSGKGQSGKAALEFLRDTMKTYGNFRKLERIKELKAKAVLSPSEEKLLEDLMKDPEIEEFI